MSITVRHTRPPAPKPTPAPEPPRDPEWTAQYRRAVLRNLPLAVVKELRDEEAARLAVLKAELADFEAQRAAAAEPPGSVEQIPLEREVVPSRVLLGR
jgi:hypothetical protein